MRQIAKKHTLYTIKEDHGRFKVYDKDSKYRQSFSTMEQAKDFGDALTANRSRRTSHMQVSA